jgi:hypothetical protein
MKTMQINIVDLVKNNTVTLDSYRQGNLYYNINYNSETYQFTIPVDDVGTATMPKVDKAMYYMRWIKPAISENRFVKIK